MIHSAEKLFVYVKKKTYAANITIFFELNFNYSNIFVVILLLTLYHEL